MDHCARSGGCALHQQDAITFDNDGADADQGLLGEFTFHEQAEL
jgi:hypothetical protein